MRWENDVRSFEKPCAPEVMSEPNKCMMLEDMSPVRLRDRILGHGPLKFRDCDFFGNGISDSTQRELKRSTRNPKVAAWEAPWRPDEGEENENDILETFSPEQREAMTAAGIIEPLFASVRNPATRRPMWQGWHWQ